MKAAKLFAKESDLCAAFMAAAKRERDAWTFYPETEGWDILAVRADGAQLGIEAKLSLNTQVVCQALPSYWGGGCLGPDFRAVLVPAGGTQNGLETICAALGIGIITISRNPHERGRDLALYDYNPRLPGASIAPPTWHEWAPARRHRLPEYVPDVTAGSSAPVQLTSWKIRAIKIEIMLERRPVTRRDFKAAGIDPTRWTSPAFGWLKLTTEGYVKGEAFPNFSAQHPINYEQIKADFAKWDWSASTVGALV